MTRSSGRVIRSFVRAVRSPPVRTRLSLTCRHPWLWVHTPSGTWVTDRRQRPHQTGAGSSPGSPPGSSGVDSIGGAGSSGSSSSAGVSGTGSSGSMPGVEAELPFKSSSFTCLVSTKPQKRASQRHSATFTRCGRVRRVPMLDAGPVSRRAALPPPETVRLTGRCSQGGGTGSPAALAASRTWLRKSASRASGSSQSKWP
jgi:hypothetical protein